MIDAELNEYFAKWDPMGFVAQGAPIDEYNLEIKEVLSRFSPLMDDEGLATMVHQVFVSYLEIDPEGFYAECKRRAPEIRKLLTKPFPGDS